VHRIQNFLPCAIAKRMSQIRICYVCVSTFAFGHVMVYRYGVWVNCGAANGAVMEFQYALTPNLGALYLGRKLAFYSLK
jgi:hypothetical protein